MLRKHLLGFAVLLGLAFPATAWEKPQPPFSCHMQSLDEIITALLTGGEIEGIVCYY